jgi:hypothetical protein
LHPNSSSWQTKKQPYMYMILMMYLRYVDSSLTFCHGLMQHVWNSAQRHLQSDFEGCSPQVMNHRERFLQRTIELQLPPIQNFLQAHKTKHWRLMLVTNQ